eukprot:TRINITY_DN5379_c0_g1_i6.p3 TRINITY_DN5379_c0_g1~~TRINITY_DN5379_c0_g1_i6.p3  ORF type:complete len:112 (+),score=13.78 TRINITY_DN5379_c0_g1_i6:244-579(+)
MIDFVVVKQEYRSGKTGSAAKWRYGPILNRPSQGDDSVRCMVAVDSGYAGDVSSDSSKHELALLKAKALAKALELAIGNQLEDRLFDPAKLFPGAAVILAILHLSAAISRA